MAATKRWCRSIIRAPKKRSRRSLRLQRLLLRLRALRHQLQVLHLLPLLLRRRKAARSDGLRAAGILAARSRPLTMVLEEPRVLRCPSSMIIF
jgi:hypothetical protein